MRDDIKATILMISVVVYVVLFIVWRGRYDLRMENARRSRARDSEQDEGAAVTASELAEQRKDNLEQVKLLFDYTKFHLTGYTTIATLLTVVVSAKGLGIALCAELIPAALLAIVAAGWAAGVVAASMPECTSRLNFWTWRTGPYELLLMTIRSWAYLEHTSFWLAVALVIGAFLLAPHC